ncbi:MAG: tRNA 2-thiouridine(34) synthase MnmA [Nitrospirae bacterium]|nr:tRNA 2-thiouridine(34) synthase MnmA [Nitrospirota bacterium]
MARVLIGMSGGVDSSVAAALLARAGHQVTGVTLKLWDGADDPEAPWQERSCCKVGIARHVCDVLGIAHRVVDMRAPFRRHVVDDFLDGYARGDTPNPCVRCNEAVKFTGLLDHAATEGFDLVATGHYARIERTGWGGYRLLKGADPNKDQSYFLYRIPHRDLARIRLPLGAMRKPQVMDIARSLGLPADEIAESQEICFVGTGDYRDFLRAERPGMLAPGDIVDTAGTPLGRHGGVALHTIGQRRGLNVALGRRAYVVATDPATRTVTMGSEDDLLTDTVYAGQLNRLAPLDHPRVQVKVRYRGAPVPATAALDGDRLTVRLDAPQRAVTPGQSVVLYQGDTVIGGGIIERAARGDREAAG